MGSYHWKIQSVLLLHTYIQDQWCITANQSYSSKTTKKPKGIQMTLAKIIYHTVVPITISVLIRKKIYTTGFFFIKLCSVTDIERLTIESIKSSCGSCIDKLGGSQSPNFTFLQ